MNRKGQIIVAAMFVLVLVAMLGAVAATLLSSGSYSAIRNLNGIQALNVAEGGLRYTIATSLAADSDWSNNSDFGPVSLSPGTFTVHYVSKAVRSCSLEVTGTVNGVSRTVSTGYSKTTGGGGGIGDQWGNFVGYGGSASSLGHEMLFNNNAKCYGNLYYYGPVRFTTNTRQSGGTIYSVTIDPTPPSVNYASWEAISTYNTPSFDPTYYTNWINSCTQSASALTGSAGTINLSGGTRRYSYINISSGTINGPGTICATGNPSGGYITITGTVKINGPIRMIARSTSSPITLNPGTSPRNTLFTGSVEVIGNDYIAIDNYTVVSPESIIYAAGDDGKYGVQIQDDAQVRGSTVISPIGVVRVMNNATMEGRLYAESIWTQDYAQYRGTSWVFLDIIGGAQIKDWSVLTQTSAGMPAGLAPGLGGGTGGSGEGETTMEATDWQESY